MYSDLAYVFGEIAVAPEILVPVIVVSYLLGSVPFGLVLTRLAGLGDVRKIGSGNIGTTNVLRTGRKDLAALTLVLDGGKGALPVLLAAEFFGPSAAVLAGIAAFLGHCFPLYLGFKGGKGVATFLGIALASHLLVGLAACAIWLAVAAATRYSSLAALTAALLTPVMAYFWVDHLHMETDIVLAAVIYLKHRSNIRRLALGEESKIGQKKA